MRKIALYGGSFSPPHLGHASIIEALLRLFPCDEIWIMPSADRRDKKITATGKYRIGMLEMMIKELFPDPKVPITISDFELNADKPTATYGTLKAMKEKHPDFEFHFVIGSDLIGDIKENWIRGKDLFKTASFVVIKNHFAPWPADLPPKKTVLGETVWLNLSSTFIRNLIAQGHSGIPYVTPKTAKYIKDNGLYK